MDPVNDYEDTSDYNEMFLAVHNGDLNLVRSLLEKYSSTETIRGRTLLHVAAAKGHEEIAKLFVPKRDGIRDTPLHVAIRENQPGVFHLLLEECNLNAKNLRDETPLHYAAFYDRPEFSKTLLDNEATVEVKNKEGKTPLYVALAKGNVQVAEVLFQHGAVLSDDDLTYMAPLRKAVRNRNFGMVKLLMANGCNKVDISLLNDSPLKLAVSAAHLEILKYLMKNGVKSSETINRDELHLFESCLKSFNWKIIKYLVDVGVKTESLGDVLSGILFWNRLEMWEYLIKIVSKIYAKTHFQEKQLHFSIRTGQLETVKAIANDTKSVYESDPFAKKLAVYIAAETGHEEILQTLLNAGYPFDSLFEFTSPLHVAATFEHPRLVKLLLNAGADVNSQTEHGLTPLHFAATAAQPAVVKLLLDSGADPSKTCSYKASSLSMSFNMFSRLQRGTNISPLTFEKLAKVTKLLLPRLNSKQYEDLFYDAVRIRVLNSNEKNDSYSEINLSIKYLDLDFRPDIVRCFFNYLSDEKVEHYSETVLNYGYPSGHTPELLQFMMEYNDSKSCSNVKIKDYVISYKSKILLINYSKNVEDLLSIRAEYFASNDDDDDEKEDITSCFKLIVARLIILTKECHPGVLEFCQKNNLNDWRTECMRQKVLMRKTKINIHLNASFYDVLTQPVSKLAIFANNKNFVKAINHSQLKFPAYTEFIKANVELAESRKKFLNECVCLMLSLIQQNHRIRISSVEINEIFKYLSILDLRKFSVACS